MALSLFRPLVWLLIVLQAVILFWIARQRHLSWWPAWLIRVFTIALVLLWIFSEQISFHPQKLADRQVLIVDQSLSLSRDSLTRARQLAEDWRKGGPTHLLITYADTAVPLMPGAEWVDLDGRASNLFSALKLAGQMLEGTTGRIILASDTQQTDPENNSTENILQTVQELAKKGIIVDVLPLDPVNPDLDVSVDPLWAPSSLWRGTPFSAIATVHLPYMGEVNIKWFVDDHQVNEETKTLPAGDSTLTYNLTAPEEDILTLGFTDYC